MVQNNAVYINGNRIAGRRQHVQQVVRQAKNVPRIPQKDTQWLPLGVFAMCSKSGVAEDSTLFLQLAISKEAIVAGTLRNTASGQNLEVEGTVDPESQRVAIKPVKDSWPLIETGLFNLTENEAEIVMHFSTDAAQKWKLVRLDAPQ